jgi:uncharacterized protein (DUF1499 family)
MRLFALLVSFFLPACAGIGAEGLPPPPPMDMGALVRPATPNTALAAPAGFLPKPDILTHRYAVPPAQLFEAVRLMALKQPRTFPQVSYDDQLQAHFVVRSAVFNFPDLVAVQVTPESGLILWSRSVYGRSDFGVNRERLQAWLDALDTALPAR